MLLEAIKVPLRDGIGKKGGIMVMPEKSDRELIQETHDSIIELSAVVLGVKGQGGLLQDFQELKLRVNTMTLKIGGSNMDVPALLQDIIDMKPRVEKLDKDLHHEKTGLFPRMAAVEDRGKDNRALIVWALGFNFTILLTILGLIITHLAN